jgi:hypothetical protein
VSNLAYQASANRGPPFTTRHLDVDGAGELEHLRAGEGEIDLGLSTEGPDLSKTEGLGLGKQRALGRPRPRKTNPSPLAGGGRGGDKQSYSRGTGLARSRAAG